MHVTILKQSAKHAEIQSSFFALLHWVPSVSYFFRTTGSLIVNQEVVVNGRLGLCTTSLYGKLGIRSATRKTFHTVTKHCTWYATGNGFVFLAHQSVVLRPTTEQCRSFGKKTLAAGHQCSVPFYPSSPIECFLRMESSKFNTFCWCLVGVNNLTT